MASRFEKLIAGLTIDKVAIRMADEYECNCEICPVVDDFRNCPAYKMKCYPEYLDYGHNACVNKFRLYLSEKVE